MATNKIAIERIEEEIKKLQNKEMTLFFFTIDSKNTPNGHLVYTYELALSMKKLGYDVKMLYQLPNEYSDRQIKKQKEKGNYDPMNAQTFCGVSDWLGSEYGDIEHINIDREGSWKVSPSDILFIPEAFASFMEATYTNRFPGKRYVLLQNFDYVTDNIPLGTQWVNFGISDCIATTNLQANMIKNVMPYVRTQVINPYIPEYFRKSVRPQNLIVNIISKKQSDVNKIVKMFHWKYPIYKFVSFRDLRGMAREHYAEMLKEGSITIWVDTDTPFGYGALEAMRCNNIVIGKIPENIQEWMVDSEGNLLDNAIWFDNFEQLPDMLADVIGSWMQDEIPSKIYEDMEHTNKLYTKEKWDVEVEKLISGIVDSRIKEYTIMINNINNEEKTDNK